MATAIVVFLGLLVKPLKHEMTIAAIVLALLSIGFCLIGLSRKEKIPVHSALVRRLAYFAASAAAISALLGTCITSWKHQAKIVGAGFALLSILMLFGSMMKQRNKARI
ncbi:MAG: hypothetical protein ACTHKV_01650 [Flavipsychrobacter sp.]